MIEYCQIELTQGKVALVSPSDWDDLSKYRWHATKSISGFYAVRKVRGSSHRQRTCLMHREIMNAPKGMEVDHANRNTLDNRRENLRLATRHQNAMNMGIFANNTSGFPGVTYQRQERKWQSRIWANGKRHSLGRFESPEKAYAAYKLAAAKHRGEFSNV